MGQRERKKTELNRGECTEKSMEVSFTTDEKGSNPAFRGSTDDGMESHQYFILIYVVGQ